MLAGKEQGLDAGRVLLADFASEPVRVQQIEIGGPELAEARRPCGRPGYRERSATPAAVNAPATGQPQ